MAYKLIHFIILIPIIAAGTTAEKAFAKAKAGAAKSCDCPCEDKAAQAELNRKLRSNAQSGNIRRLKKVLAEGADPNGQADYGETALYLAAIRGNTKAAGLLLEAGADPNLTTTKDVSPLMAAAWSCNTKFAAVLMKAGADPNITNRNGQNALVYAARRACPRVIEVILKSGKVNVNQVDDWFKTPLDYAAERALTDVGGPASHSMGLLRSAGASSLNPATAGYIGRQPLKSGDEESAAKAPDIPKDKPVINKTVKP